ncbi:hypothetical protein ABW19_dt0200141 [Dactylella cylindrospora]|nr:hypothetical protein ABW19_dt0200141 [Dactylella cylindrospora]
MKFYKVTGISLSRMLPPQKESTITIVLTPASISCPADLRDARRKKREEPMIPAFISARILEHGAIEPTPGIPLLCSQLEAYHADYAMVEPTLGRTYLAFPVS